MDIKEEGVNINMDVYCLSVFVIRLLLIIVPIILSIAFRIWNQKVFIVFVIITVIIGYFMFINNQVQVSPIYKHNLSTSEISELYQTFKNSDQALNVESGSFASENNFYGSFKFDKGNSPKVKSETKYYEYRIDKYTILNRDYKLLGLPVDYSGRIIIYSKEDDMTLTINYRMYLKNENSNKIFSYNEFSCSGINDDYSLKNITFE